MENLEWWEEGRKPTLAEAWEMLSGFVSRELEPMGGQDGTAEVWEALETVEEAIKPLLPEN